MLQKVGFEKAELVGETGFNSTPKTKGVLLRAEKPLSVIQQQESADDTALYDLPGNLLILVNRK